MHVVMSEKVSMLTEFYIVSLRLCFFKLQARRNEIDIGKGGGGAFIDARLLTRENAI